MVTAPFLYPCSARNAPHSIALLGGIAFLQIRETEEPAELPIVFDERFAAEDVSASTDVKSLSA